MIKVHLLYPDRDFQASEAFPPHMIHLEGDLGLDIIYEAMARDDGFIREVVRQVLLNSLTAANEILYRQAILKDFLDHRDLAERLYRIPNEYLKRKREQWLWVPTHNPSPVAILDGGRRLLEASLDLLRELREIADQNVDKLKSAGLTRFFTSIQEELSDAYLAQMEAQIKVLRFPKGVHLSARLGPGNEGTDYLLRKPHAPQRNPIKRVFTSRSPVYSFALHPRDDAGARVLDELRNIGLARAARAVARAAQYIEGFLVNLRWELAFYRGCLNLYEKLSSLGEPLTFPRPLPPGRRLFSCRELYDPTLALVTGKKVVGNDISTEGKDLFIITGPNGGGKTVFLRSVGIARVMMQSGMFVPAASFSANLCTGFFTHFRREEDRAMESGKLEEELRRMSAIAEHLRPNSLVLFNESFSATNEREGAEIADQIVKALLEKDIEVFYVTHLYEFARRLRERETDNAVFLRAERLPDGRRTFKIKEGELLETSYGLDLYRRVFRASSLRTR